MVFLMTETLAGMRQCASPSTSWIDVVALLCLHYEADCDVLGYGKVDFVLRDYDEDCYTLCAVANLVAHMIEIQRHF